jgi:hypothetical protein
LPKLPEWRGQHLKAFGVVLELMLVSGLGCGWAWVWLLQLVYDYRRGWCFPPFGFVLGQCPPSHAAGISKLLLC